MNTDVTSPGGLRRPRVNTLEEEGKRKEDGMSPRMRFARKTRRTEETSLEMVAFLNRTNMRTMELVFSEYGEDGVTLTEFIYIVQSVLPPYIFSATRDEENLRYRWRGQKTYEDDDDEEETLVHRLCELFAEIDVNGDGKLQWDEFTRFIVSKARMYTEYNAIQNIPKYQHLELTPCCETEKSLLVGNEDHCNIKKQKKRHRNLIDKILPLSDLELLAVTEQHSNVVQLYDSRDGITASSFTTRAQPLSMTYVNYRQSLLVACSDTTMTLYQPVQNCISSFNDQLWQHSIHDNIISGNTKHKKKLNFKERARWPTPETLMSLCWAESQATAYGGNSRGSVFGWRLFEEEDIVNNYSSRSKPCMELEGHSHIVMDLLHLNYLENLVSASLDSTVRVWDTYTQSQTLLLKGHKKGVNALAYNAEHRFIVSAGFDHDAFVWSPFVSTLLFKLKGHEAALVDVHAVEGTHELITGDSAGILKLWDLRTFQCVQTFTTEHEPGDLDDLQGFQAMTHIKLASKDMSTQEEPDFRLVTGTKKLFFFDQHRVKKKPVTDALPLRFVLLNELNLTLLVVIDKTVRIWDALLGTVKRTFEDISKHEITAVCLDDRNRKFFLGTDAGDITCYNYVNGAAMKSLPSFAGRMTLSDNVEVTKLQYISKEKALLAGCVSGVVRLIDERDPEICVVLRQFEDCHTHRSELKLLVHYEAGELAATASCTGTEGIRVWDVQTAKCDAIVQTKNVVVLALGFLEPYPLLYVCTSDCLVSLWVVAPRAKHMGTCLLAFANIPPAGSEYETALESEQENNCDGTDSETNDPFFSRSALPEALTKMGIRPRLLPPEIMREQRRKTKSSVPTPKQKLPNGVCATPCAVSAAAYNSMTRCLFLGDELGNLRCFDLGSAIDAIIAGVPDASYAVQTSSKQDTESSTPTTELNMNALRENFVLKPHELQAHETKVVGSSTQPNIQELLESHDTSRLLAASLLSPDIARFIWSVEYAHEQAVLSVSTSTDPCAVFTSGLDRCVKMWDLRYGYMRGILLQRSPGGGVNPCWSLEIDVDGREQKQADRVKQLIRDVEELRKKEDSESKTSTTWSHSHIGARLLDARDAAQALVEAYPEEEVSAHSNIVTSTEQLKQRNRVIQALTDVRSVHTPSESTCDGSFFSASASNGVRATVKNPRKSNTRSSKLRKGGKSTKINNEDASYASSISSTRRANLSVVPPFPKVTHLGVEAQSSLDRLSAALALAEEDAT